MDLVIHGSADYVDTLWIFNNNNISSSNFNNNNNNSNDNDSNNNNNNKYQIYNTDSALTVIFLRLSFNLYRFLFRPQSYP